MSGYDKLPIRSLEEMMAYMLKIALARIGRFVLVSLIILSPAILSSCAKEEAPSLPNGSVIPLSQAFTGEFTLTDVERETKSSSDFQGKPSVIYFGFTSCPDVCPAALSVLSAALNELGPDAAQIQPLFIALDPERDTPEILKDYLAFDPRIEGLTGTQDDIEAAKTGFKVYARRIDLPESALGYTIEHSSFFYLTDAKGTPRFAIRDTLTPQQLAGFLRQQAIE